MNTSTIVTVVTILVAALFGFNGAYMLSNPESWYWAIDGVPDTGPFNPHFVRDIGFMYVVTGAAMVLGWLMPDQRLGLWGTAAAWHICHACFHVWEVVVGICGPEALVRDFVGVTLPSVLALTLAVYAYRQRLLTK